MYVCIFKYYTYSLMCVGMQLHVSTHSCMSVCVKDERAGISCAAPQDGQTPLFIASQGGHLEVVGALLAKGADVEAKDDVSIARAWALCPSRSLTHAQNAHGCL